MATTAKVALEPMAAERPTGCEVIIGLVYTFSRAGALVAGREFVEGEVKSIADQRVTISSVLFGLRTLEGDQRATAVFLRAVTPRRCRYEIKLRNGSCLRADLFDCEKGGFVLRDGVLRGTRINTWELLELRLLPGTKPR